MEKGLMLSKSDIQSYRQCARKLWLEQERRDLTGDRMAVSRRRERDGNSVGEKAREQLGRNYLWPRGPASPSEAAMNARALLAANPGLPAVEVPMVHDHVYARADALVPDDQGYVLRETKASTFPLKSDGISAGAPDDHHIDDLTIQAWVMTQSGLPMRRAELNLLDGRWRYPGGGDYRGLFRQLDATSAVIERLGAVPHWIAGARAILNGVMPDTMTGPQCGDPYQCLFVEFCLEREPAGPDHPIELLPDSAGKKLASKLKATRGYSSILEPDPSELTGSQAELYRRIQRAHRLSQPMLDQNAKIEIAALGYPRYFLDFEAIDLAVPIWTGARPYEHIPFQWSCHIERSPGRFDHAEFLDLSGSDPSLACVEGMRQVIDPTDHGPILVYYAPYERGRLKELAKRHPEHASLLSNYVERIVDLLPIVKRNYYHPDMQGSFSIKKVLKAISDINYQDLDEVQDGEAAQIAYLEAALDISTTPVRKSDLDTKLRRYCRQDTWAMVEVAYFLAQAARPLRPTEG